MSTFSSVVNKSDKKFAPKATARRNVPPRATPAPAATTETSQFSDQPAVTSSAATQDATASSTTSETLLGLRTEDNASLAQTSHTGASAPDVTPSDLSPSPGSAATRIPTPSVQALKIIGQARKDATRAQSTVNEEERSTPDEPVTAPRPSSKGRPVSKPSLSKRMSRKQAENRQANNSLAGSCDGHVTEAQNVRPEGHDQDGPVQIPVPKTSATTIRGTRGGTKRKAGGQTAEALEVAPGYTAASSAPETDATPASQASSRKRRKVTTCGPAPATAADVTQDIAAMADDVPTEQATPSVTEGAIETIEQAARPSERMRTKKMMADVANDTVAEAAGQTVDSDCGDETTAEASKKRRRKRMSKEDAEAHEIAPTEVKMADLIKDKGLGKKSRLEARMEEVDWDDVKKKRKEQEEEAEKRQELDKEQRRTGLADTQDDMPTAQTVPKMTIRNGQIVMEEESRLVDRHAEISGEDGGEVEVQEVDDVTKRINQSTIGRRAGVKQKGHWNDEATDLFYKGLRMFGTDFMMISKMFPGMSRRHIKLKYVREERANLRRIHENLHPGAREPVDLEEFSAISNQVYDDHEKVYDEMKADEAKLREEDVARRAREAEIEQGGVDEEMSVLQSREQGSAEPTGGDEADTTAAEGESSAKENRFASVARSVIQAATAPKKPKKQTALQRKRERKRKTGLEGTEEVLGSIEEVQS